MNATMVFRVISLIPERTPRAQSGCAFNAAEPGASKHPERLELIARFLHWLGPLDPLTKEQQQFLGLRSSGGRPMAEGEELEVGEEVEAAEDLEDLEEEPQSIRQPEAGTQIAV